MLIIFRLPSAYFHHILGWDIVISMQCEGLPVASQAICVVEILSGSTCTYSLSVYTA